jgi:N-formylglutamate deformylase
MNETPFFVDPAKGELIPLLVSLPHAGCELPSEFEGRIAEEEARQLPDTDWHLRKLYSFVPEMGADLLSGRFSRYVVDLNRPPDGAPMYPGRSETELVPTSTFAGLPIYEEGKEPQLEEIQERVACYWRPYHDELTGRLEVLRERFGYALLWEGHSIVSFVPRFATGKLPDLMLGDVEGVSAAPPCSESVFKALGSSTFEAVRNQPFKGGYITRKFGKPEHGIHALQLEMCQHLYMEEAHPFPFEEEKAQRVAITIRRALEAFVQSGERLYS